MIIIKLFSVYMVLLSCIQFSKGFRLHGGAFQKKYFLSSMKTLAMQQNPPSSLQPVRVRFAPSPTGSLHVGGARTALFNWLLAKKTNGKFIVRVEDTDESRSTKASEQSILNDLKWLNLHWDEGPEIDGPYGPYRQSERKHIYKEVAEKFISEGKAYRCFCTEEELEKKKLEAEAAGIMDSKYDGTWRDADPVLIQKMLDEKKPYTVRFKVPPNKIVSIDDIVRGKVTWDANNMLGDFIILRSSGMPVYNFCVSVDDASMHITHVIRAEEHLSNTLRQVLILEAMGYTPPTYAHCSLILGSDRSKLSKRHGATSVTQFQSQGFYPAAMINYLANLGWNDGTPKEIYSPQELISAFDMSRIIKGAAIFDMNKLTWINSQHLRALPFDQIQPIVLARLQYGEDAILEPQQQASQEQLSPQFPAFLNMATKIAQRDMDLTIDTNRLVGNCLRYDLETSIKTDIQVEDILNEKLLSLIATIQSDFQAGILPTGQEINFMELWKQYVKQIGGKLGLKGKHLFHPLRFCLTGRMSGPDIGDQLQLLALSKGIVKPNYPMVSLAERVEKLGKFSLEQAKEWRIEANALLAAAAETNNSDDATEIVAAQ